MTNLVIEAYLAVADGCSTDFLIACPQKNAEFVEKCRVLGLDDTPYELNRKLLNLRKRGALGEIKCKRTHIHGAEDCQFAAEVAVRFIERRDNISSTDALFCDPQKAEEFDSIAAEITPGFLPQCYRWAALKLRKTRKLQPELVSRVLPATKVFRFIVEEITEELIPTEQGLYMFSSGKELLYVGEAENLRVRLKKHLIHSDNKW